MLYVKIQFTQSIKKQSYLGLGACRSLWVLIHIYQYPTSVNPPLLPDLLVSIYCMCTIIPVVACTHPLLTTHSSKSCTPGGEDGCPQANLWLCQDFINRLFHHSILVFFIFCRWASSTMQQKLLMFWRGWTQILSTGRESEVRVWEYFSRS